jgi:Tfp pilus assembly protein PilE
MLELFIAVILIAFLALFAILSYPMKTDDVDYRDNSQGHPKTNE